MTTDLIEPIIKLKKEVRQLGELLSKDQARGLVDLYYRWQEHRIALAGQMRAATVNDPATETALLEHFSAQVSTLERQMVGVLDSWTDAQRVGQWAKAQMGIGPILSAGLLAHIDIEKAPTVGKIWRFAGLDPTVTWNKGQKRPWNADLKVLCWKIGDSFVKVSGREDAFYGQLYRQRKEYEVERNVSGGNADAAAATLIKFPKHAQAEIYKAGKLPDGRIDMRARRWTTKLFLAHWHEVAYQDFYGEPAPKPYVIEHMGHTDRIVAPPG